MTGAQRRALLRRAPSSIIAISFALILATAGTAQAQTAPPEECEGVEALASEIEGEVIDRLTLVDEFSTNIDLVTVATANGTSQIEIDGKPELVEVGETYRFTVITVGLEAPALLSSAFGENLSCLTQEIPDDADESGDPDGTDDTDESGDTEGTDDDTEAELLPVEVGVFTVDEDGVATPIEEPPFLPALPVSPRTFFIGFGVFAVVIFLLRFR